MWLFLFALAACSPREDAIGRPPPTPPLSGTAVGYGVVAVSYTRVMSEPGRNGVSLGYVREGTVLEILERRLVRAGEDAENAPPGIAGYWVLTEGTTTGWLPESQVVIYESREKAETASAAGR